MPRNVVFRNLVFLLFIVSLNAFAASKPLLSGGSGSSGDPWQISSTRDWEDFAIAVKDGHDYSGEFLVLTSDLDFIGNSTGNLLPVGSEANPFKGTISGLYEGNQYSIQNFYQNIDVITTAEYNHWGVFGYIDGAQLRNIHVSNVKILGYSFVGGLVGVAKASTITNSYVSGYVFGNDKLGGFIGRAEASTQISNSYASTLVKGNSIVGGFIGELVGSSVITNCYVNGGVDGGSNGSGFVYAMDANSQVNTSYSIATVYGKTSASTNAAFAYENQGKITNCLFNTDVTTANDKYASGLSSEELENSTNYGGWDAVWGNSDDAPWIQPESVNSQRPYMYWQSAIITNGDVINNVINITITIINSNIGIVERGVRTMPENGSEWTNQFDGKTSAGNFDYSITGINEAGVYYVQPYFLGDNGITYLGTVVKTSLIPDLSIRYDGNQATSGNTVDNNNPYLNNKEVGILPNGFLRQGYSFSGWNNKIDGSGIDFPVSSTLIITSDTVLYAQWSILDYDIIYHLNGGQNATNPTNPTQYTIEDEIHLQNPSKPGYSFRSWYMDEAMENNPISTIVEGTSGELNLYAKWYIDPIVNTYKLNYVTNGGVLPPNPTVEFNVETPTFSLVTPTRPGYTFDGWYTDDVTFLNSITEIEQGTVKSVTVYAKWYIHPVDNIYKINYELEGGIADPVNIPLNDPLNPTQYHVETSDITLLPPSREGYSFEGWYSEAGFENKITMIKQGSVGDTTLYAKWLIGDYYTISYQLDGGNNHPDNITLYDVSTETFTFYEPNKIGYSFEGWYGDAAKSISVTDLSKGSTQDTTLYANWEIRPENYYTIDYVLNEGSNPGNRTTYNIEDSFTLLPSEKNGYTFGGWFKEADFSGDSIGEIVAGTYGDLNLHAYFYIHPIHNVYSITYHLNGGVNNNANPSSFNVESETILLDPAGRTGYTFGGWYYEPDFSGDVVTSIPKGTFGHVDLYAQWVLTPDNDYVITYELFDGDNDPLNPEKYNIETETIIFNPASKRGYSFGGWFRDANYVFDIAGIEKGSVGDTTVYANWYIHPDFDVYDINYELNGGENHTQNPTKYDVETEVKFENPTKPGYTFSAWYGDEDKKIKVSQIALGSVGDTTVYADWFIHPEYNVYAINYELNGGLNSLNNPTKYDVETEVKFENPTKPGYTFSAWYGDEDKKIKVSQIALGSVGDTTVYADWYIHPDYNVYAIDYELNGGVNSLKNPTKYDVETEVKFENPTKPGYTFSAWYGDEDKKIEISQIALGSVGDTIVYADWYIHPDYNVYAINYELNGGDNHSQNPSQYNVETEVILKQPSKTGYTFSAWYADEDRTIEVAKIALGSVGDTTVFAGWYIHDRYNNYAINYVLNGGENHKDNPSTYNIESKTIEFKEPTKEHYVFGGWYLDDKFTQKTESILTGSHGEVTVYAKWTPEDYNLIYHLDGGENHKDNPDEIHIETPDIELKEPVKPGYTFEGWFTDDTFEDVIEVIVSGATESIQLFAKWNIDIDIICKWGYVLLVNDPSNELKPEFQWYKDGVPLADANQVSYSNSDKKLCGTYTCEVSLKATNEKFMLKPVVSHFNCETQMINVYPSIVDKSSPITLELFSGENNKSYNLELYSMNGVKIISQSFENGGVYNLKSPNEPGFYILHLSDEKGLIKRQTISVK